MAVLFEASSSHSRLTAIRMLELEQEQELELELELELILEQLKLLQLEQLQSLFQGLQQLGS